MRTLIKALYSKTVSTLTSLGFGRFLFLRQIYRFLKNNIFFPLLHTDTVSLDGHTFYLDPSDALGLSIWGIHEPLETALVKRRIKPGTTVMDIGANIGYYTLLFAKLTGPTGKVFAFEPYPPNFQLLDKNVRVNQYSNVVLVPKSVTDSTGESNLYLSGSNNAEHSTSVQKSGQSLKVPAISIDDYFSGKPVEISFIKIDIEGGEYRALCGMQKLLETQPAVQLLIEFAPFDMKEPKTDAPNLLHLLEKLRFSLFDVKQKGKEADPLGNYDRIHCKTSEPYKFILSA